MSTMATRLSHTPARLICETLTNPDPNTMAFGGVATGNMNAQLALKNEEINYLLDEIQKLRDSNREKMRKLETANASEQNALNELISSYKKEVLELKRRNHELESTFADEAAQAKLKVDLARQDLSVQK